MLKSAYMRTSRQEGALKEPCLQRMRREEKVLGKGSMATGCELSKEKGWWQGDMMEVRKKMCMAMRSGSVVT